MTSDSRAWTIARDDFGRVRQSRLLWGVFALTFLLVVPNFWTTVGGIRDVEGYPTPAEQAALQVPADLATYLFLLVVALAYGAVVAERESGTVRLLLGLPATRRDVLAGKLLSRLSLVVVTLAPLLVILGAITVVRRGTIAGVAFGLVSGWVLLYGAAWTTFAVGLSAAFRSQYRALAAIASTYVCFAWNAPIWGRVLRPILTTVLPVGLESYADSFNPTLSLLLVSEWLVAPEAPFVDVGFGPAAVSTGVLLSLGVAGLLVGSRRFERADLG